jgi:hypothetical protein
MLTIVLGKQGDPAENCSIPRTRGCSWSPGYRLSRISLEVSRAFLENAHHTNKPRAPQSDLFPHTRRRTKAQAPYSSTPCAVDGNVHGVSPPKPPLYRAHTSEQTYALRVLAVVAPSQRPLLRSGETRPLFPSRRQHTGPRHSILTSGAGMHTITREPDRYHFAVTHVGVDYRSTPTSSCTRPAASTLSAYYSGQLTTENTW